MAGHVACTPRDISAGVGPNARADAQIILEGIRKTVTESQTKESNYVVWQRQLGSGSTVETMTLPSFTGPQRPVFNAPGGLTVQVPDGELRTQIQTLSQQPGMGYLSELSQRSDVDWQAREAGVRSVELQAGRPDAGRSSAAERGGGLGHRRHGRRSAGHLKRDHERHGQCRVHEPVQPGWPSP
jgi:hypothetical protein